MKETMDSIKVLWAVIQIKRNLEIETVTGLERAGLERICRDNDIDYKKLTEEEREEIRIELIAIVEEIEFCKAFSELYMEED